MNLYPYLASISVIVFSLVHLFAERARNLNFFVQGKLFSLGGGIAIAYVFIDLLPKLAIHDLTIKKAFEGIFPYLERHAFIMALLGFLLFFVVDRNSKKENSNHSYYLSLASYGLFNFFVGYAVVDKYDPEVHPLALFTIAMALHYFANDYALSQAHGNEYDRSGKWILVASLFLGWGLGFIITLPEAAIALISAFIGGGVIMNVIRHELPKENPNNLSTFLISSLIYAAILLAAHA